MGREISRREVFNNLIRFKDSLLEMRGEQAKEGDRVYKVLVHRRTGDMRFSQKIKEHHLGRKGSKKESLADWKEVEIVVHQKNPREIASFEVRDGRGALKPSEWDALAWEVVSETIDVLNYKAKEMKGTHLEMLAEEAVLLDLSSIHLRVPREKIQDLQGWMGSINRVDAERILSQKPVGTYLLREGDEITLSISFHFADENHLSIHPYLLTVLESRDKIAEFLLLETNRGWIRYHDDPDLKDPSYHYHSSARALVQEVRHVAKQPLS